MEECKNCKKLAEYKEAYDYLLNYWDSFNTGQQREINKELNKVFKLNTGEQVDVEEEED